MTAGQKRNSKHYSDFEEWKILLSLIQRVKWVNNSHMGGNDDFGVCFRQPEGNI